MEYQLEKEDGDEEYVVRNNPEMQVYQHLRMQVNERRSITLNNVKASWTVEQLLQCLRDNESVFADCRNFSIMYRSKAITENGMQTTLAQLGLQDSSTLVPVWNVVGGATAPEAEGSVRQYPKDTTTWLKKITPSTKPCFSSSCDLDEGFHNAQIPCCQTVVAAQTAYIMLKGELFQNKSSELKCKFSVNCKKPISFGYYAWLAQLSSTEKSEFQAQFNTRALTRPNSELQKCPNEKCGAYVEKADDFPRRVRCPVCRAYDWCWVCRKRWIGSGKKCGNTGCELAAEILENLINSETETISGINNVPIVRLCPKEKCRTLIKWTKKCKHVTCPECAHQFCMSCLQLWKSNHLSEICTVVSNESVKLTL